MRVAADVMPPGARRSSRPAAPRRNAAARRRSRCRCRSRRRCSNCRSTIDIGTNSVTPLARDALRQAVQRRAAGCRASPSTAARSRASTRPSTEILSSVADPRRALRVGAARSATASRRARAARRRCARADGGQTISDGDDVRRVTRASFILAYLRDAEAVERCRRRSRCTRGRWRRSVR